MTTPRTWFTSDWHLDHKSILDHTERAKSIPQGMSHSEWVIKLANETVGARDSVYHLGDFCFSNVAEIERYMEQIPGALYFVVGNHDKLSNLVKAAEQLKFYKKITILGEKALFRSKLHTPNAVSLTHNPELVWRNNHYGAWQLHGHCHGSLTLDLGKSLDVGLDNAFKLYGKHQLFSLEDVQAYMQDKEIKVWDHHAPKGANHDL